MSRPVVDEYGLLLVLRIGIPIHFAANIHEYDNRRSIFLKMFFCSDRRASCNAK